MKTTTATEQQPFCEWTKDGIDDYWNTGCGQAHEFTTGGPEDNNHKFCPYCGKPLKALHCESNSTP